MISPKVFVFLFLAINLSVSQAQFLWARQLGGLHKEEATAVVTDANGNVYTAGYFEVQMDADPGSGTFLLDSLHGGAFIVKLDPGGNLVWAKNVGSSDARITSMELDPAGNILASGTYSGTGDFDPGPLTSFTMSAQGSENAFVLKLSNSGNLVWARTLTAPLLSTAFSLATDLSGNVLIGGRYSGTIDLDPGPASATATSAGVYDAFLCKLDATGSFVWGRSWGDTAYDAISAVTCDAGGNIICAGMFNGLVDFDPGLATVTLSSTIYNVFVLKLTNSGGFTWVKKLESKSAFERVNAIKTDASGNIYSTGYCGDSTDFDPGPLVYMPPLNANVLQGFVWKLGSAGGFFWAKFFRGLNPVFSQGIVLDNLNNSYVCGLTTGGADFDPGALSYTLSASIFDSFVCKLDSSGDFNWAKSTGGQYLDKALGLALDAGGNIITVGSFSAIADFDPGSAVFNFTAVGLQDAFVQKLSPCALPATPIDASQSAQVNTCFWTIDSLTVLGNGTFNWYQSPYSSYIIHTGPTYSFLAVSNNTFYVEAVTCAPSRTRLAVSYSVNPNPTVNILANGFLCQGDSTVLQATGASNYTWSNGSTTSSIIVHPPFSTTYKVRGKNIMGCGDSSSVIIVVQDCTSIPALGFSDQFKCYPNPSTGYFAIEVENELEVIISNCLGQVVSKRQLAPGKNEFIWNKESKGIYFIQISDSSKRIKPFKLMLE